ncbi:MAG: hypothetical protein MUE37_14995, partial [Bacteroidales bacterium]|nr:hypothetical protein [Bacteroidales bacterium]
MKQTVLILLLVSCALPVNAQFGENNALYIGNEFNVGGYFGVDISLNYLYQEKYSVRLGYTTNTRIAKSIPSDYSPGIVGILTLGMNTPSDNFRSIHLDFGFIKKLNDAGTARMNLSVGLGFVSTKEPVNWQKTDGFMTENYTWDYETDHSVSLVVNPKFEFPFSRYWGLSISPMLQVYDGGTFFVVG